MPPPSSQAKPDEPPNQFLSVQCAPKPGCTRTSRVAVSGSIGRRRRSGCRTRATCRAVGLGGAGHAPAQTLRRTPRSGRSRTRTAIRRGAARCVDEATRRTHRSARRLAARPERWSPSSYGSRWAAPGWWGQRFSVRWPCAWNATSSVVTTTAGEWRGGWPGGFCSSATMTRARPWPTCSGRNPNSAIAWSTASTPDRARLETS